MRVPIATYRVQFNREFRFNDARSIVRYLAELGITDLYASPILKARPGSMHGYDMTDPTRLNPEVGTNAEFASLVDELEFYEMGLLLDIVPNHMAASSENPYWCEVLEHGQASRYANFFDIDWNRPGDFLNNKVMLPILGAPYESCLDNRELTLSLEPQGFLVSYYDYRIPVDPRSYPRVLTPDNQQAPAMSDADRAAFDAVIEAIGRLGPRTHTGKERALELQHLSRTIKERLWRLYGRSSTFRAYLDRNIARFNGAKEYSAGVDLLDRLLADQAYRLCYWRKALEEINYRRFFDINDLAAVRIEDPEVAETTHELIFQWIRDGKINALRIDHIDGLYDPAGYLSWLQDRARFMRSWSDFYVVVEKILTGDEELPESWQTAGTTGYEFIPVLSGVFLDRSGMARLRRHYNGLAGSDRTFFDVRYENKKRMIDQLFASEMKTLEQKLFHLAATEETARTIKKSDLCRALREISACLPVYRTYLTESGMSEQDRRSIASAIEDAERRSPKVAPRATDFLRKVLLAENARQPAGTGERTDELSSFVCHWQQLTGPLMAKGLEDTTHYVYNCLISQNEVGSDPAHSLGREQFHAWSKNRREKHPYSLNATATHDTKRGEDVRARIHVLSELAPAWEQYVDEWRRQNHDERELVGGKPVPDANAELFLYQTLIGAWPFSTDDLPRFKERVKRYMVKAAREAKLNTSWLNIRASYEAALGSFIDRILDDDRPNPFLRSFETLQRRIAFYGALNSLSQLLLKISVPGVPDFYQGTDLWDLNLVDPDNRRAVDFATRTQVLSDLKNREPKGLDLVEDLLAHWGDGRIKLYVTYRCLGFRKGHSRVFLEGDYVPLKVAEARQRHLLAFARRAEPVWVVTAVPRLLTHIVAPDEFPLGEAVWSDTRIRLPARAPDIWANVLTGETLHTRDDDDGKALMVGTVLRHLPVALLAGNANLDDYSR